MSLFRFTTISVVHYWLSAQGNPPEELSMIEPIFAWSWEGHGQLTSLALTAAITQLLRLGKSNLMKRFLRLYRERNRLGGGISGRTANLYENVDRDPVPSVDQAQLALSYLFRDLRGIVQRTDLHVGNIPWGVGEFFDSKGQVRHFMRSTPSTNEMEAYMASRRWISDHLNLSYERMRNSLYSNYGLLNILSNNVCDFIDSLTAMGEGLHTAEDSYAPGHVGRDPTVHSLITSIHYWDKENKTAHGDWPGHEALDDPETPMSPPFSAAPGDDCRAHRLCAIELGRRRRSAQTWRNGSTSGFSSRSALACSHHISEHYPARRPRLETTWRGPAELRPHGNAGSDGALPFRIALPDLALDTPLNRRVHSQIVQDERPRAKIVTTTSQSTTVQRVSRATRRRAGNEQSQQRTQGHNSQNDDAHGDHESTPQPRVRGGESQSDADRRAAMDQDRDEKLGGNHQPLAKPHLAGIRRCPSGPRRMTSRPGHPRVRGELRFVLRWLFEPSPWPSPGAPARSPATGPGGTPIPHRPRTDFRAAMPGASSENAVHVGRPDFAASTATSTNPIAIRIRNRPALRRMTAK